MWKRVELALQGRACKAGFAGGDRGEGFAGEVNRAGAARPVAELLPHFEVGSDSLLLPLRAAGLPH